MCIHVFLTAFAPYPFDNLIILFYYMTIKLLLQQTSMQSVLTSLCPIDSAHSVQYTNIILELFEGGSLMKRKNSLPTLMLLKP